VIIFQLGESGDLGDVIYTTGIGADGPDYLRGDDRHVALVALVAAIAADDPAAINDVVDELDRSTVNETERVTVEDFRELIRLVAGLQHIVDFLVRHALRSGDVAAGDHAAMREWLARQ
jgi:hypothetical protein